MSERFLVEGLRFYVAAFIVGIVLMLVAPINAVRALCAFAICCAAAGFAIHLYALSTLDPGAFARLRERVDALMRRTHAVGSRAVSTAGDAGEMSWPCVMR